METQRGPARRVWWRRTGTSMIAAVSILMAAPGRAEPVALELLLAVDVSPSINRGEYILQMQGLAAAVRGPEVIEAIGSLAPRGVAMALLMWAGVGEVRLVLDWRRVANRAGAEAFADEIDLAPRLRSSGGTAIGDAIRHGARLLAANGFEGARAVIDVSGDGPANRGLSPSAARDAALAEGLTVNGLAILNEAPGLDLYYLENVIGGPAAFVETTASFEDFAEAMIRKLSREIRGGGLVRLAPARTGGGRAVTMR